jgi:HSP20 family protein
MVRWYYQSIFDELEEMRKYMESLSRQMYDTSPMVLLPGPAEPPTKMLPTQRAGLRVDVAETDRDVVVTADMIPGVFKKDITLTLIIPARRRGTRVPARCPQVSPPRWRRRSAVRQTRRRCR